jgi:hypothetical protein
MQSEKAKCLMVQNLKKCEKHLNHLKKEILKTVHRKPYFLSVLAYQN